MTYHAPSFARRKAFVAGTLCFLMLVLGVALGVHSTLRAKARGYHSSLSSLAPTRALRPDSPRAVPPALRSARLKKAYARLPLSFEANRGQAASQVGYLAHSQGYTVLLTADGAILAAPPSRAQRPGPHEAPRSGSMIAMTLEGANRGAALQGTSELPGKSNYFLGSDPANWRTGIPTFARVVERDAYPGIDLVYYGNQRELEYDFVVRAGANPEAIDLHLKGAGLASVSAHGDLVLESHGSRFVFRQPVIYQADGGARKRISGGYILGKPAADGSREVRFRLGRYDRRQALVIDPSLSFSTYLGGTANDYVYAVGVDSSGDAYAAGYTSSTDFPTLNPYQSANQGAPDAFVTKFNAAGSALVYSTYLGGSAFDQAAGIAVDAAGNAYLTGITYSTNFPTTAGVLQTTGNANGDAFAAELNAAGSVLVFSTYLGGSGTNSGNAIAVDSAGDSYVTGNTSSSDFPLAGAYQSSLKGSSNAFVSKIAPGGTKLLYSTYLGGSGSDGAFAIAVGPGDNPYIAGETTSNDFPTANAYQASYKGSTDAFVAKLNFSGTNATLAYSTYLGGTSNDQAYGIALDSSQDAYVSGATSSTNFPVQGAFQSAFGGGGTDAFVTKLDPTGSKVIYSTYLGGSGVESIQGLPKTSALAVDSKGKAYLVGVTASSNFPLANPLQSTYNGNQDAFITVMNPMGCGLSFSTYMGGSASDYATGVAVDSAGDAIVGGVTQSNDFLTAKPWQVKTGGGYDGFVAKIPSFTAPSVCLSPNSLTFGTETSMTTSQPMSVTLTNAGDDALDITSIAASGPYGETNTCGTSVAAGQNCTISVTFSPVSAAVNQLGLVTVTDNAAGATGATQTINLLGDGADFELQISPTTNSVTAGQTATYTVTLLASTKFADMVSMSCNGVPAPGSCKIAPTSIQAIAGSNSTAKLTVTTVAKSSVPPGPFGRTNPPLGLFGALLAAILVAAAVLARRLTSRLVWLRVAMVAGVLLLVTAWFGCGVSNPAPSYTPSGNYTIQITGTDGALVHSVNADLTVQ